MKKKNGFLIYLLMVTGFVLIITNSCEKDDDNGNSKMIFNPGLTYGTVTDIDGNVYKTIKIGTQTWMAENLRTTKYRNGEIIHKVTDSAAWGNLITGAYCDYNNTPSISTIYGKLYNWYTVVDTCNICPTGWHVPTYAEWNILIVYLGDIYVAGGKLKEIGTTHWNTPNAEADNSSGFTALPGGGRFLDGRFCYIGDLGYWWSSTGYSSTYAYLRYMYNTGGMVLTAHNYKKIGFSVRCLRD